MQHLSEIILGPGPGMVGDLMADLVAPLLVPRELAEVVPRVWVRPRSWNLGQARGSVACPRGPERRLRGKMGLREVLEAGSDPLSWGNVGPCGLLLFLTVTMRNVGELTPAVYARLKAGFKRLRRHQSFADVRGGVLAIETTRNRLEGTWHPHQ